MRLLALTKKSAELFDYWLWLCDLLRGCLGLDLLSLLKFVGFYFFYA